MLNNDTNPIRKPKSSKFERLKNFWQNFPIPPSGTAVALLQGKLSLNLRAFLYINSVRLFSRPILSFLISSLPTCLLFSKSLQMTVFALPVSAGQAYSLPFQRQTSASPISHTPEKSRDISLSTVSANLHITPLEVVEVGFETNTP